MPWPALGGLEADDTDAESQYIAACAGIMHSPQVAATAYPSRQRGPPNLRPAERNSKLWSPSHPCCWNSAYKRKGKESTNNSGEIQLRQEVLLPLFPLFPLCPFSPIGAGARYLSFCFPLFLARSLSVVTIGGHRFRCFGYIDTPIPRHLPRYVLVFSVTATLSSSPINLQF